VAIYRENTVVSVHFPVSKGRRSTKPEHYPPDAFRYMQWDSDYSYSGIKTILEKNLEKETGHITQRATLDASFARNIHELLQEESAHGMQQCD
jgi:tRNA A37 threonylcarbamoyltransferase TsaD